MSHESNPFKVLSTRDVYDNNWVRVVEHQILSPSGNPGIYGVIHFKNRAVGVIPYENGKIWLVGQYRFPLGQYSWEIPEGGSPFSEDLIQTAHRELKEETGLEADSIEKILEMHLSNSVSDEYAVIYLARGLTHGKPHPEDTEQLKVKEVSLDEVYAMVTRGEITDSLSVAGILKLMTMRYEGKL